MSHVWMGIWVCRVVDLQGRTYERAAAAAKFTSHLIGTGDTHASFSTAELESESASVAVCMWVARRAWTCFG